MTNVDRKQDKQKQESHKSEQQERYQLFKTDLCGFCFRVRGFLEQHGIEVPLRDINQDNAAFRELLQATGRGTVPCLRIERGDQVHWMHESMDIIQYLAERHGIR